MARTTPIYNKICFMLGATMADSHQEIEENAVFKLESTIRGHHISKKRWNPRIGEILVVLREPSNPYDAHAVAIHKDGVVVGHVPREYCRAVSFFIAHGGEVTCEVIGHRQYGKGLEIPCSYNLAGKQLQITKFKAKTEKRRNLKYN